MNLNPAIRLKTTALLAATALAVLASQPTAAATYDFSQSGFPDGTIVTGTLTLDIAAPTTFTLAELNAATWSISVDTAAHNDFVLTEANSTWFELPGSVSISATLSELTFDIIHGFLRLSLDDNAAVEMDTLSFLDYGDSLIRIGDHTSGNSLGDANLGTPSPSFTFAATSVSAVPLPATGLLLFGGLAGFGLFARGRRSA